MGFEAIYKPTSHLQHVGCVAIYNAMTGATSLFSPTSQLQHTGFEAIYNAMTGATTFLTHITPSKYRF